AAAGDHPGPPLFLARRGGVSSVPFAYIQDAEIAMSDNVITKPRGKVKPKIERPRPYKENLLNDDHTPRNISVRGLSGVFRMSDEQAYNVMMTAHQKGACVVALYTREVAESKAKEATELGKGEGYPLFFSTEPEK